MASLNIVGCLYLSGCGLNNKIKVASLNIVGQTLINVSHIAQRSREIVVNKIVVNVSHIAHRSREMITYADFSRAVGLYWT